MKALAFLGCLLAVGACSESGPSMRSPRLDSGLAERIGGCTRVTLLVVDGGCRVQWSCSEGGSRVLTCQQADSGFACACEHGVEDPSGTRAVGPSGACAASSFESTATALCGWSFP